MSQFETLFYLRSHQHIQIACERTIHQLEKKKMIMLIQEKILLINTFPFQFFFFDMYFQCFQYVYSKISANNFKREDKITWHSTIFIRKNIRFDKIWHKTKELDLLSKRQIICNFFPLIKVKQKRKAHGGEEEEEVERNTKKSSIRFNSILSLKIFNVIP